jgi:site-specific recombinase XerC
MTHYYQTFYEDLKLTGKSNRTIDIYEKHLQKIERYYNKSPEQINEEEMRRYLIAMKDEKQYSESFFKQLISAFRFFYGHILEHADWKTLKFIKPQKERRLPDVLSREEVKLILSHVRVPRQKAFLFTLYSLGLRLSELFHRFGQAYLDRYGSQMPPSHGKTLHDIRQCRTSVMGGKRFDCPQCNAKIVRLPLVQQSPLPEMRRG